MKTRVISGAVLAVITIITLIYGGPLLAAVCFFISVIGYRELCKATGVHTKDKFVNGLEIVGSLGVTAYYAVMYFCEDRYYMLLPLLFVFMGSMLMYVLTFPRYRAEQVMANFFHFVYAPVMLSFIFMTRNLQYGEYIVWLIFLSSWGSDTFAYFVGVCFGKKRCSPC